MGRTVEQLFARYQRCGDARAIATVYERVAPDLLLIAVHVGHRQGNAEDLVQSTFLAALEAAATYDYGRPLMPWLVGILVNQARREHRARRRSPDPARLPQRIEDDPAIRAEHAELAQELSRTIGGLPAHYRQVMTLRWVHGLSAIEIAHTLGIPPATVKTRLRRGTEILRQVLPAGFAASAALMASTSRTLAAVGTVVTQHARQLAIARGMGQFALGTALRWLAACVACAVAGSAAWSYWGRAEPPNQASQAVAAASPPGPAAVEALATAAPGSATASPPRQPVDVGDGAAAGGMVVQVRWADGVPAPGVHVGLVRERSIDPLLHERWLHSDADGRIALADLEPGSYALWAHQGGSTVCAVHAGRSVPVELTVPAGIDLRGRVLGAGNRPLVGAAVWLSRQGFLDELHEITTTDAQGQFAVRAVEPGRSFTVFAEGYSPWPMQRLDGQPGDQRSYDIDLAAEQTEFALSGRVLDDSGAPVAGALVQVGNRRPLLSFADDGRGKGVRVPPHLLRTDADGAFAARGIMVFDRAVNVWVRAAGWAVTGKIVRYRRAHETVELRLRRGHVLEGRALAEDGTAVANVRVVARDPSMGEPTVAPRWAQAEGWSDAAGRFRFPDLRGPRLLFAFAEDGRRASTALDLVTAAQWDAIVASPRTIAGVLVDGSGAPAPGLRVHVVAPAGSIQPEDTTSDGYGHFAIDDAQNAVYTVEVDDPQSAWSGPLAAWRPIEPSPTPHRLVVPAEHLGFGVVSGRVFDQSGQPATARMFVGHLRPGVAYGKTSAASGDFRIERLPAFAAPFFLWVEIDDEHYEVVAPVSVRAGETTDLGAVYIRAPGQLVVRVARADGGTVEGTAAIVWTHGAHELPCAIRAGAGGVRSLPPGQYELHFRGEGTAQTPTRFTVRSGEETRLDVQIGASAVREFAFAHPDDGEDLRLRLSWFDADGMRLCTDTMSWPRGEPAVLRQRLAPGRYLLRAESHAGRRGECVFAVDAAAEAATVIPIELR